MTIASRSLDILRISIRRVFRQRRRYLGSALAIVLGTAGLMLVMTMSGDIKKEFNKNLDLLGGATVLQVYFEDKPLLLPWTARERFFHTELTRALRSMPGVAIVSFASIKTTPASVTSGPRQYEFTLVGVDAFFWHLQGFMPMKGEFFGPEAMETGERVCVIGAEVARRLFDTEDVVGRTLIIESELYRIIGVLEGFRVGEGMRFIFLPLSTALSRIKDMTLPVRIFVRCTSWDDVQSVAANIPMVVGDYLHTDRLRVEAPWDNLKRVKRVAYWLELFANVCVVATLVLGGLGIWNIMMAGVRSRTREIGIKKAIGAEDRDILLQFMTESLVVCLCSCLAGIVLGGLATAGISHLLDHGPGYELFLSATARSAGIALLLGIVAGIYPAYRASRMEVASALRHE